MAIKNRIFVVMMDVQAIFLDVDGTLVSFETHQVPASALDALQQVHELGLPIVIATGRSHTDLHELAEVPYQAVVSLNGAECVWRDGRLIDRQAIELADFLTIQALARQHGVAMAIETSQGIFVSELNERVMEMTRLVNHPLPTVATLEEVFRAQPCCQVCLYADEAVEQAVMAHVPRLQSSRWNPLLADINVAGVNKAWGVEVMCRELGLNSSQVMAFGDGGNDISMLRAVGVGVAMGNASEAVKSAARYTTDSVERDGLLKALRQVGVLR